MSGPTYHTGTVDSYVRVHQWPAAPGTSIVSLVKVTVNDISYEEVAIQDTRPLDTRKWGWRVIGSFLTDEDARALYVGAVAAIRDGRCVYGASWINGSPEPITSQPLPLVA